MAVGLGGFAVEKAAAQNAGTPPTWAVPFQRSVTGAFPFGISAGDVNGDGFPEVAVVSCMKYLNDTVRAPGAAVINIFSNTQVWSPPEAGLASTPTWTLLLPEPLIPYYVELADINGDNRADVIVTVGEPDDHDLGGYDCGVYVFRFDGAQFLPADFYPSSTPLGRHRIADMNGDQLPDIVASTDQNSHGQPDHNTVRVFHQDCANPGLFLPETVFQLYQDFPDDLPTSPCAVGNFHRKLGVTGGVLDIATFDFTMLSNNGNNAACQDAAYTKYAQLFCDPLGIITSFDMVSGRLRQMVLNDDIAISGSVEGGSINIVRIVKSNGGTSFIHTCSPGVDYYEVNPTFQICNLAADPPEGFVPVLIPSGISAGLLNAGSRVDLATTACDGVIAILLGNGNATYDLSNSNPAYFVHVKPPRPRNRSWWPRSRSSTSTRTGRAIW